MASVSNNFLFPLSLSNDVHPLLAAVADSLLVTYAARHAIAHQAIWRFTLLWTLLMYGVVFGLVGLACIPSFSRRHLRLSLLAPVISIAFGLALATFTATVLGFGLAGIYSATNLAMSTFVPALYAIAATLGLIVTSSITVRGMM